MQKLAQSWLVLDLTGSAFLLGLDAFLGEIPIFLFSLLGGVAADRGSRRNLLLASQFVQMGCAFLLTALLFFDAVQVWHILALSFTVGLAQAFGGPAYQALIPSLVGPKDLPNAIAMNSIQFNLARIIGPMLGGLALEKLGATWCFGLNGLSYVAVIVSLFSLRLGFVPAATTDSVLESMKQGVAFIRRQEAMVSLMVLSFFMTLFALPLIVFLPVIAREVFQGGPGTYTLFLSISGAGSVCGALVVAYIGHQPKMGRLALCLLIVFGVVMAGFSLSKSLVLSSVLLFLAGASLIAVLSLLSSLVQMISTDAMRGRVMSVYNLAFRGGTPFGSLMSGALVPVWSAPMVLALNGVLLAVLGGYFLVMHKRLASL
jgi:predicted MFS family arabinose efflux permease